MHGESQAPLVDGTVASSVIYTTSIFDLESCIEQVLSTDGFTGEGGEGIIGPLEDPFWSGVPVAKVQPKKSRVAAQNEKWKMKQGCLLAKVIDPILCRAQVTSTYLDVASLPHTTPGFTGLDDRQGVKQLMAQLHAPMAINLDNITAQESLAHVHPECNPLVKLQSVARHHNLFIGKKRTVSEATVQ
ncbi:hypothetical protein PILCRDRAFT_88321 [Piloderma croceum F 1598]|uniref:Uncharacterized protein n=1 Tax=Piloderma croceum (strain F 1598) TaxID=765440 RepID=A0A0C3FEZ8_PILCF|nr:hypothetical protein PILCRDRAFT_88321 [Piloderma croceum F 1598]